MSFLVRGAFAGIARGLCFRVPDRLRTFEQHCRTIEEIERRGVNVVLDVGANVGFYSQHLRQSGYKGRILAFEPVPESFTELRSRADGDAAWQVFNCALGSVAGSLDFHVVGETGILSSVLPPHIDMPTRKIVVPMRTLADVLAEQQIESPRIFLKMDTQGFDLEVFKGSGNPPEVVLLQSEVCVHHAYEGMPHYTAALSTFEEAGFRLLDTFPVTRTPTGGVTELDALMGRP
jgi:FkbM family methyltransferase